MLFGNDPLESTIDPRDLPDDEFEDVAHEMKSAAWGHFYRSKSKTLGRCKYCGATIRTLGGTTTAMKAHLRTKHNLIDIKKPELIAMDQQIQM